MYLLGTVLGQSFIGTITERFVEGGLNGMLLILACLLLAIFFTVRAFANLKGDAVIFMKYKKMINQVVLLGLVISFANSLFGLIQGFDALEASGAADPAIIAGGLKITLLSPLFGLLVFILGHTATFILSWLRNENGQ